MAEHAIAAGMIAKHDVTLVAGVVDTFTFEDNVGSAAIFTDGAAKAYVTFDGSTPTIGGANCYLLPAMIAELDRATVNGPEGDQVKVVSAGTPTVTVYRGD